MLVFSSFLSVAGISHSFAYPTMIQYGYPTCDACHYSPQGGGLLTDYGRGVGAAQSLFASDYKPPEGPLVKFITADKHIRHGLEVRPLLERVNSEYQFILMQVDYMNSIQPTDWIRLDTTFGWVPEEGLQGVKDPGWTDHFVFRKILGSVRPKDGIEFSVGRDAIPIGLNIDNHTTFIRFRNRRENTDFVTQVRADLWTKHFLITPFGYLPGYQESMSNREKGGGLRFEFFPTDYISLGVHGLIGHSDAIDRKLVGTFARAGSDHFGLLAEYDFTNRALSVQDKKFNQHAIYVQPFFSPVEWAQIGVIGEFLKVSEPFSELRSRIGPNVYLRFTHYLSMVLNMRYEDSQYKDTWVYFAEMQGNF